MLSSSQHATGTSDMQKLSDEDADRGSTNGECDRIESKTRAGTLLRETHFDSMTSMHENRASQIGLQCGPSPSCCPLHGHSLSFPPPDLRTRWPSAIQPPRSKLPTFVHGLVGSRGPQCTASPSPPLLVIIISLLPTVVCFPTRPHELSHSEMLRAPLTDTMRLQIRFLPHRKSL
jgi:hypothetical protein